MKNKRKLLKFIIVIDIILAFFVALTLYNNYYSKSLEQKMLQLQTEQKESKRKQEEQERLEKQKEQEELARQEQEKYEAMKESLPTKFNMRDKIKITAEDQHQKPFCSVYAHFKSMEIALNYQDNYNYDFKKVYNYLKTAPDELPYKIGEGILYDLSKELLGIDFTYEHYSRESEDFMITLKNEIVNGRPILIDINDKLSNELSKSSKRKYKWKWT